MRVQFLDGGCGDQRVGVAARYQAAHIHLRSVIVVQEDMSIGQQREIVGFGHITIGTGNRLMHVVVIVQHVVYGVTAADPGVRADEFREVEVAVRQELEIVNLVGHLLIPDWRTVVLQNHHVESRVGHRHTDRQEDIAVGH